MPKGYIEYQDRIGSQHELTTPGNRKSDVVISAIEKCEKLEQEVKQLRQLLKECKEYLSDVDTYCTKNADESYLLITRINAAIGESEE